MLGSGLHHAETSIRAAGYTTALARGELEIIRGQEIRGDRALSPNRATTAAYLNRLCDIELCCMPDDDMRHLDTGQNTYCQKAPSLPVQVIKLSSDNA